MPASGLLLASCLLLLPADRCKCRRCSLKCAISVLVRHQFRSGAADACSSSSRAAARERLYQTRLIKQAETAAITNDPSRGLTSRCDPQPKRLQSLNGVATPRPIFKTRVAKSRCEQAVRVAIPARPQDAGRPIRHLLTLTSGARCWRRSPTASLPAARSRGRGGRRG